MRNKAIVIGCSAGGLHALEQVLRVLPSTFPHPIFIVQHMTPDSDDFLSQHLNRICNISVKEAEDKEITVAGIAYLAPPGYHLLVETDKSLSLSLFERVNYSIPSIDVLFDSAADTYGKDLIGVVMTGASKDGSRGLQSIEERGGISIVQDPETAESPYMPTMAIQATRTDYILPLHKIGHILQNLSGV